MAKVEWSAGIDSVSGALSKPSKSGQHSCSKMLLGTHRVAATTCNKCNRLYLRKKVERSTPVTQRELQIRARFSAISALIATKRRDPVEMQTIQAAFLAQKDDANGYKTLNKYLWATLGDDYDKDHPNG